MTDFIGVNNQVPWYVNSEMLLLPFFTCKDCLYCRRCIDLFGGEEKNKHCTFSPSRFKLKPQNILPEGGGGSNE